MRTLRRYDIGDDVRRWETFLVGFDPTLGLVVDQEFDEHTFEATKAFQRHVGMTGRDVDGIVGPKTFGAAMQRGFDPLVDQPASDIDGPNWPPRPVDLVRLDLFQRRSLFGAFEYEPAPTKANPEAIRITDGWADKNITKAVIPQLADVRGAPASGTVQLHVAVVDQLKHAFEEIERMGLCHLIISWDGSWVPRYVRGSRRNLSNHAWGTAFDINAAWNALGTRPALRGNEGSVRELVEVFYKHGFAWGGWYRERPDGMHFEAYRRS